VLMSEKYQNFINSGDGRATKLLYESGDFFQLPFPTFEGWLISKIEEEEFREKQIFHKPVSDIRHRFSFFIEVIRHNFTIEHKREPTIDELKESFDQEFSSSRYSNRFYLACRFEKGTQEEYRAVLRELARLLKPIISQKRFRQAELKRYLRVYDLREKKMKWKDIFLKVYPNREEIDFTENARRALRMDYEKAAKAITKLERNDYFWWS
jgi:hypothetical protein